MRRLVAYQNADYARLYLDRLKPIAEADARANAAASCSAETARHLAVRMSFEDVIRVAEAKIDPERFRRIEGEIGAKDQPYVITEFLKPGIEELCQVLPAAACARDRRVFGEARLARQGLFRHGAEDHDRVGLSALLGRSRSSSASARRAGASPRSRPSIEAWLARVAAAAKLSGDLALEVAECARLIKGYGDTWKRGCSNYATIEARVIAPVLEGRMAVARRHRRDRVRPHRRAARSGRVKSLGQGARGDRRAVALPLAAE